MHAQHYGGATRAYPPADDMAGRWFMRFIPFWATRSLAIAWVEASFSSPTGRSSGKSSAHAAAVIVLGEPVKKVLVEEKDVPAERVSVIYPGIDLGEYERAGVEATIQESDPSIRLSCTSAASFIPTRACRS